MYKWAERTGSALAVLLLVLYGAAKLHFFMRYDARNVGDYVDEHWPFWAGMMLVTVLLLALGRVGRPKAP